MRHWNKPHEILFVQCFCRDLMLTVTCVNDIDQNERYLMPSSRIPDEPELQQIKSTIVSLSVMFI